MFAAVAADCQRWWSGSCCRLRRGVQGECETARNHDAWIRCSSLRKPGHGSHCIKGKLCSCSRKVKTVSDFLKNREANVILKAESLKFS